MNVELTAEIRFRCPHCQKLYCSDASALVDMDNHSHTSEFECFGCSHSFFLLPQINDFGLYMTEKHKAHEFSTCPKCSFLKPLKADECPSCGVLESKFSDIQQLENPRLYELNKAWKVVIQDFTNDANHQMFLDLAQSHSALNFAAQKYSELTKNMGYDTLTEKYMKQVETRLESQIQNRFQQEKGVKAQLPVDSDWWEINGETFFIVIALIGVSLLIFNKIRPTFPNLNGLIVAITLLSFGLWSLSLSKHSKK